MLHKRRPAGLPRRRLTPVQLLPVTDFRGGLNLRADAFQLKGSESPDLMNIDLDPRGGFAQRGAVSSINQTALNGVAHSIFSFATVSGTEQVLVGVGKNTLYSTGTDFTDCGVLWTVGTRQRATDFNNKLYLQNGTDAPRSWDGASISAALGATFVDDYAAPTAGNMPKAKYIATHIGSVFVANTVESGTAYPNRIRWSHPNRPEDYRTQDYIDINVGHDGDQIVGLAPWNDRLLIFKANSVHVLSGYNYQTYQVFPLSQTTGAISQEAVCVSEHGVYWFSWPGGVFFYDGHTVQWLWEKLVPCIQDGSIPAAYQSGITCGWLGRRVWVSVPWGASTTNSRVFVLDPTLAKDGGWTRYDLAVGPVLDWRRAANPTFSLACTADTSFRVLRVDQTTATDTWYADHMNMGAGAMGATTPDSAALSIVGDIDIRVRCALTLWTPAATQFLAGKWEPTGNQRSYGFYVDSAGKLNLDWSNDGTAVITKTSTVVTGITNATAKWVRVTLTVNNAGSNDVKFYTGDDNVNWTQLGTTVTTAGATSIFDSTATATVGGSGNTGATNPAVGKFYKAEIRNGIVGTVVANPDFTRQTPTDGVCFTSPTLNSSRLLAAQGGLILLAQGGGILLAGGPPTASSTFVDSFTNTWTIVAPSTLYSLHCNNIASYYFTKWLDVGSPSMIKKWKRPEIVMKNDATVALTFSVYRDFDVSAPMKQFALSNAPVGSARSTWGTMVWGTDPWGASATGAQAVVHGGSLGRGRSIQLKIVGPSPSQYWSVNALNIKYLPKRLR